MGLAVSWLLVGYATARQRLTPPRLQGRVTSATDVLINGPQTVSIALGALLIDLVDYRMPARPLPTLGGVEPQTAGQRPLLALTAQRPRRSFLWVDDRAAGVPTPLAM